MNKNKIEDIASTKALKIIGLFISIIFIVWLLNHFIASKIIPLLPSFIGNSFVFFLQLLTILTIAILTYFYLFKKESELIRANERLNFIFNENPNPLLVIDKTTLKILHANNEAISLLDCSEEILKSTKFLEFIHRSHRADFNQDISTNITDQFYARNIRMTKKKGEDLYSNLHFKYADNNTYIISIYDITPLIQLKFNFSLLLIRHKQFESNIGDHVRNQFNYISNTVNQIESLVNHSESTTQLKEIDKKVKELEQNFNLFSSQFNNMYEGLNDSVKSVDLEEFNF